MPWKETCSMNERMKLITEYLNHEDTLAELCRQFEVSRKTAYKWIARFEQQGCAGLEDLSRATNNHHNAVTRKVEKAIVELRGRKMKRGPLKLLAILKQTQPQMRLPCPSTVAEIIKRHGLVSTRTRRAHAAPTGQPLMNALSANDIWCVDFKGWFRCGNGKRCDPLTISDAASRYLLRCQVMTGQTGFEQVRPLFEAAFREYGLPLAIHSDNGIPFASIGLAGLSRLSVWWIRLGIRPDRSRPGKPQDNGRHERMHRTLKEEAASPPAQTPIQQQRAFDDFVHEYNIHRPHQALGQKPPALFYEPSPRQFPSRLPPIEYPDQWEKRKVRNSARIKWQGQEIHISKALIDDGLWRIYFSHMPLGIFDEKRSKVSPMPKEKKEKKE